MAKTNKGSKSNLKQDVDINISDESRSFSERIDEIRGLVEENLRYTKSMRESGGKGGEILTQRELQKLLQENLKVSKELYEMTKKIKRWVSWQRVWGIMKILIIIIPIILGVIYLPPLIKEAIEPFQQLLNIGQQPSPQEFIQDLTN